MVAYLGDYMPGLWHACMAVCLYDVMPGFWHAWILACLDDAYLKDVMPEGVMVL